MGEDKSCSGDCKSCGQHHESEQDCRLKLGMSKIKNKLVVMSGKGGVGKSTVAVNLAAALALEGKNVGLLDVDIHGPSVPKMLHLENQRPSSENELLLPVAVGNLKVMSIGFLLHNPDDAVIWRGPAKIGLIKQLLSDVVWGDLDYLVIDCPPGTGDEPLSICQMIPDGQAVLVTTPQQVAASDVAKSLNFCNQLGYKVLGIVENMAGFVCPKCGEVTEIFSAGAGEELAARFNVKLLGRVPIDPAVCRGGDAGTPFVHSFADSAAAKAFAAIIAPLLADE
ncbi:MAG: P-loop NTPase [Victivallaceae bacterium]|nr:Mrp/NBP35 family ATP-binding protein [Victivallaceae bacterium]